MYQIYLTQASQSTILNYRFKIKPIAYFIMIFTFSKTSLMKYKFFVWNNLIKLLFQGII